MTASTKRDVIDVCIERIRSLDLSPLVKENPSDDAAVSLDQRGPAPTVSKVRDAIQAECVCGGGDGKNPPCVACRIYHAIGVGRWFLSPENPTLHSDDAAGKARREVVNSARAAYGYGTLPVGIEFAVGELIRAESASREEAAKRGEAGK